MKNIIVLLSGQGSNLQALIEACACRRVKANIAAVFSNNPEAYGLVLAQEAEIPAHVIEQKRFVDRAAFDASMAEEMAQYHPDLVVLSGYLRILSQEFVARFAGKMLNIHPSLLPKYPGLHTHRNALENGEKVHGTSIHFVTDELDGGPLVLQSKVPVFNEDTEEVLTARIQAQEHIIYPLVVNWFVEGRLKMREGEAWLDGVRLPKQGYATK
ncbi:MAG: phosphoribosylglycinamide formyltransferase [Candidatus Malihini olakiniferum]